MAVTSRPTAALASTNAARSTWNLPAYGFFTTATAATLRSGVCAGWPASLRVSSTNVRIFRICMYAPGQFRSHFTVVMPGLVPDIHVFVRRLRRGWHRTSACPRSAPQSATSRVNPTCGDKPGHDAGSSAPLLSRAAQHLAEAHPALAVELDQLLLGDRIVLIGSGVELDARQQQRQFESLQIGR